MAINEWWINSSPVFTFSKFYSGSVTFREAGKCRASVSHWSDSASVCAAQTQPWLLLFHLDHSSLPWLRMLKLTGLSSFFFCLMLTGFLLLERRSPAHCLCLAEASACFSALFLCFSFSSPSCSLCGFTAFCFFFVPHSDFLSLFILFYFLLERGEKRNSEWGKHSGVTPHLKCAHFSGTVQPVPVQWMWQGDLDMLLL